MTTWGDHNYLVFIGLDYNRTHTSYQRFIGSLNNTLKYLQKLDKSCGLEIFRDSEVKVITAAAAQRVRENPALLLPSTRKTIFSMTVMIEARQTKTPLTLCPLPC